MAILAALLAGCGAPPAEPQTPAPATSTTVSGGTSAAPGDTPSHATACSDLDVSLSAGAGGGTTGQSFDQDLGGKRPNLTAVLVELKPQDSAAGAVGRLHADLHDQRSDLATSESADPRGVYALRIQEQQWSAGNLSVRIQPAEGSAFAQTKIAVCTTQFVGGPADEAYSAFP